MGKVTFEFDENNERNDIELVVNRYKMICALDESEKYRYDLYNGHCEEIISVRDDVKIERGANKTIEEVRNTKTCLEVDYILRDVQHLVSL